MKLLSVEVIQLFEAAARFLKEVRELLFLISLQLTKSANLGAGLISFSAEIVFVLIQVFCPFGTKINERGALLLDGRLQPAMAQRRFDDCCHFWPDVKSDVGAPRADDDGRAEFCSQHGSRTDRVVFCAFKNVNACWASGWNCDARFEFLEPCLYAFPMRVWLRQIWVLLGIIGRADYRVMDDVDSLEMVMNSVMEIRMFAVGHNDTCMPSLVLSHCKVCEFVPSTKLLSETWGFDLYWRVDAHSFVCHLVIFLCWNSSKCRGCRHLSHLTGSAGRTCAVAKPVRDGAAVRSLREPMRGGAELQTRIQC